MQDTLISVPFIEGAIEVWHKSYMGNLNQLFDLGNVYRYREGKNSLPLTAWIQRHDVIEYADYLSGELGRPAIERRKGRSGGTYAHLNLMVDAAMSLSAKFKHEVISNFISNKILLWRDDGGELFKDMNAALLAYSDSILGKPAHKGHYITLALAVKNRVGVLDWYTATAKDYELRARLEDKLVTLMKLGLVRDWEHLKELVDKV